MTFRIGLLGLFFALGTLLLGQTSNPGEKTAASANREKQSAAGESMRGCVDEQNGHYVLRNEQTSKIVSLQAPNSDNDAWFAKYVGHKVEASGAAVSDSSMRVAQIRQVSDMCGTGK